MVFFGECREARKLLAESHPDLEIHFRLPSKNVPNLHDRYGQIVDQLSTILPSLTRNKSNRIIMATNELVSNALKYRVQDSKIYVKISVYGSEIIVEVHNSVGLPVKHGFIRYLVTLFESDLDRVYIKQIDHLVENPDAISAKLGLVSVLRDCQCDLGYVINDYEKGGTRVTAYARIILEP